MVDYLKTKVVVADDGQIINIPIVELSNDVPVKKSMIVDGDEFNTIYTKRLFDMTSTSPSTPDHNRSMPKVGDVRMTPFVTSTPSNSSKSFDNTFKVLEKQLMYRRLPQLTSEQLNYILSSYKNDKNKFLFMNVDVELMDQTEHTESDFFELELEASRRIREKLQESIHDDGDETCSEDSGMRSEMMDNAGGSACAIRDDDVIVDGNGEKTEYPEYIYHIAKGKDGRLYLRIVKSLLVDRGLILF